jgi:hypothetical protein
VPHVSPAAEAHKVEKTNCFSFRFLFFKTTVVCDDSVHQATDEDLMPKHEAMLALEDGPLEEAGDTGNSEREPEQPPSGTVEVQQPGEDFEEDSLAKMQRALKSRDDGKGNIEKLGAKPKAVGCMRKPAASKKVELKAKAKVVPKASPKATAKKAGQNIFSVVYVFSSCILFCDDFFWFTTEVAKKPSKSTRKLKMTRSCVYSRAYHQMK